MLSNFQTADKSLLQTFLLGQPEFRRTLLSGDMQQLRQRVIATYHLGPMDAAETRAYIEHRLNTVGWRGDPSVSEDAFAAIHDYSGGIPRKINTLCDRLFLMGYLEEIHDFRSSEVNEVIGDIQQEFDLPAPEVEAQSTSNLTEIEKETATPASLENMDERLSKMERSVISVLDLLKQILSLPSVRNLPKDKKLMPIPMSASQTPRSILCVVGARPNFMKMAPIMAALADLGPELAVSLVHTGQHYDVAMNHQYFEALGIPQPDINLEVGSGSHAVQTAEVMRRFEPVLDEKQPSAVLVVGDVNSTLACALVAAKKGVPVIHVEAGLRSFDRAMPEEINRILTDQISDLLFTTERSGRANLLREGIAESRIQFVGNVMIDTLRRNLERAVPVSQILKDARQGRISGRP